MLLAVGTQAIIIPSSNRVSLFEGPQDSLEHIKLARLWFLFVRSCVGGVFTFSRWLHFCVSFGQQARWKCGTCHAGNAFYRASRMLTIYVLGCQVLISWLVAKDFGNFVILLLPCPFLQLCYVRSGHCAASGLLLAAQLPCRIQRLAKHQGTKPASGGITAAPGQQVTTYLLPQCPKYCEQVRPFRA